MAVNRNHGFGCICNECLKHRPFYRDAKNPKHHDECICESCLGNRATYWPPIQSEDDTEVAARRYRQIMAIVSTGKELKVMAGLDNGIYVEEFDALSEDGKELEMEKAERLADEKAYEERQG